METKPLSLKERINKAARDTFNCLQTGEEIKIRIYSDLEAKVIADALSRMADSIQEELDKILEKDSN